MGFLVYSMCNIEDVADREITLEDVLDGYPIMFSKIDRFVNYPVEITEKIKILEDYQI